MAKPAEDYKNEAIEKLISKQNPGGTIDLSHRCLTSRDMRIITEQALDDKKCVELHLSKNPRIDAKGFKILGLALEKCPTLVRLYITHLGNFSEDAIEALAQSLQKNTSIQILDLTENGIDNNGAEHLAKMLQENRILRSLNLSGNRIHNDGIQALSKALATKNQTLEFLSIEYNPFGEGCVQSLVDMLTSNRTLTTLHVLKSFELSPEAKVRLTSVGKDRVS